MKYRIVNMQSGHDLGVYEANSESEAFDALARDAGYENYADACEQVGKSEDLVATPEQDCEHPYATKICPKCGAVFCYECCKSTNVHEGGKHEPDYMLCPNCGHDYYAE